MTTETDKPLHLHAELLPNIRQVTLYITISQLNAQQQQQQLEPSLSESRRAVTVSLSEYVSETIKLPARVSESSRRILQTQEVDRREFSFRMQIDPQDEDTFKKKEDVIDDFVPWTAGDMKPWTRLACRECGCIFLSEHGSDAGTVRTWKDLPSGNWAEMMDFWHCHKPDTHEDDKEPGVNGEEENALVKGYGAANRVVSIAGTGLVDVGSFLVVEGECRGLMKATSERKTTLRCEQCNNLVGIEDHLANGYRLFKANLSATSSTKSTWTTHPPETIISAQLLELIERESARRFAVYCGQNTGLLLWVFNPDLRYSNSSSERSITAQRGMKVFFQNTDNIDAMINPETGKTSPLSLEELELPGNIFAKLEKALVKSSRLLPESARRFREWNVGLLNRFER